MSEYCSHIKPDKSQCKRYKSSKPGDNRKWCWQHQQVEPVQVPKIKIKLKKVLFKKAKENAQAFVLSHHQRPQQPQIEPQPLPPLFPQMKKLPIHAKPSSSFYVSLVGPTKYRYGQQVTQHDIMGRDNLDICLHESDPDRSAIENEHKVDYLTSNPLLIKEDKFPDKFDIKEHCISAYQTSVVTFDSINDIIKEDPKNVVILGDYPGRCIIVNDYILSWRHGLTVIDPQSFRVKPQYPRDLATNEEMIPEDVYKILNRGAELGLIIMDDNDPLWFLLKDSRLLTDLYNFIRFKYYLNKAYLLMKNHDKGAWNRRDLILIDKLKTIYVKNNVKCYGWRLYTNVISCEVQVFETCLMVAKLNEKFVLMQDYSGEYQWVPKSAKNHLQGVKIENKDPCRMGVTADIIGQAKDSIFLM